MNTTESTPVAVALGRVGEQIRMVISTFEGQTHVLNLTEEAFHHLRHAFDEWVD